MDAKQFEPFFAADCSPVSQEEQIRPTRVVWKVRGGITTKVFPTEKRALDFAENVQNLIAVQDVNDPPPSQIENRILANQKFAKYGKIRGWWKK